VGCSIWNAILRYPTYSAISELFFLATHTPPLLTGELAVIRRGFLETGLLVFQQYQVLTPVLLWTTGTLAIEAILSTSSAGPWRRAFGRFFPPALIPVENPPPHLKGCPSDAMNPARELRPAVRHDAAHPQ
jgi:hypothetical protein